MVVAGGWAGGGNGWSGRYGCSDGHRASALLSGRRLFYEEQYLRRRR